MDVTVTHGSHKPIIGGSIPLCASIDFFRKIKKSSGEVVCYFVSTTEHCVIAMITHTPVFPTNFLCPNPIKWIGNVDDLINIQVQPIKKG